MSQRHLWISLAVVWLAAATIAALLLWIDLGREKVFWLIPYPSWRAAVPQLLSLFASRPLMAIALVVIPISALVATIVLTVNAIRARPEP